MMINIIREKRRGRQISQKISTNNSQFSFITRRNKRQYFCCTTYLFTHTLRLHLLQLQKLLVLFSFSLLFIVELDQHFSMTVRVRCAPTSEHFVLQVVKLIHQCFIAPYKLFKQIIGYISWKVSLVRIHPNTFSSPIVFYIFVNTRSNIYMVILLQPFLEGFVALLFSMFTVDRSQHWRRHVFRWTVC